MDLLCMFSITILNSAMTYVGMNGCFFSSFLTVIFDVQSFKRCSNHHHTKFIMPMLAILAL